MQQALPRRLDFIYLICVFFFASPPLAVAIQRRLPSPSARAGEQYHSVIQSGEERAGLMPIDSDRIIAVRFVSLPLNNHHH